MPERPFGEDEPRSEAFRLPGLEDRSERVRYGPIYDYIWPSGIGPRVAEPALMLINPYPWSAPLEEVRLKKP